MSSSSQVAESCKGTPEDEKAAKALAEAAKPAVKKLLVREATCKENPLKKVRISLDNRLGCRYCDVTYLYPACLVKHIRDEHGKAEEEAKRLVSLALSAQVFQATRSLERRKELFAKETEAEKNVDPDKLTTDYDEDKEVIMSSDGDTAIFLVFYDIETTGLQDPDIIEVSFFEPLSERSFTAMIKPQKEIEWQAECVHKISMSDLEDKPPFSDVCPEILDFIDSFRFEDQDRMVLLCAYNGNKFDQPILEKHILQCGSSLPEDVHFCDGLYGGLLFPFPFSSFLSLLTLFFLLSLFSRKVLPPKLALLQVGKDCRDPWHSKSSDTSSSL